MSRFYLFWVGLRVGACCGGGARSGRVVVCPERVAGVVVCRAVDGWCQRWRGPSVAWGVARFSFFGASLQVGWSRSGVARKWMCGGVCPVFPRSRCLSLSRWVLG